MSCQRRCAVRNTEGARRLHPLVGPPRVRHASGPRRRVRAQFTPTLQPTCTCILAHLLALMHIGQRDRPETTVGLIDLALGERHNVHLHPQLAVRVVGEPWMLERDADCLFGAVGEADADDDHVERD